MYLREDGSLKSDYYVYMLKKVFQKFLANIVYATKNE